MVASLVADALRRLPNSASSSYTLPGTPSKVQGLALSSVVVSGAAFTTRLIGRLRSGRPGKRAPITVGLPGVVALDGDADRLRRRGWVVLAVQLLCVNVGIGALAGDFAWLGVIIAIVSLLIGVVFTALWRRREHSVLGPGVREGLWIPPRPAGVVVGVVALVVLAAGVGFGIKGLRYLVLRPTIAQLKWSNFFGVSPRVVGWIFAVGGLLLAVGGSQIFRLARRLSRAGTHVVLNADKRAPILFLRSFEDDAVALRSIISARRPFFEFFSLRGADPFEETLAWELTTYGPLIAVARPGSSLANLGAAREFLSDDTWQTEVADRMRDSAVIVMAIGQTDGLGWEVRRVVRDGHLAKTIFVFPPVPADVLVRRWQFTASTLSDAGIEVPPLIAPIETVHVVNGGSWVAAASARRRRSLVPNRSRPRDRTTSA